MNISLEKAKSEKLFYFVATGVIYHPKKKRCLLLKRSAEEKVHPGLWGVIGGKLEWRDLQENKPTRVNFDVLDWEGLVEKLIQREAKEESGLKVEDPYYLDSVVFLRPDNIPVVCFKFAVKYIAGRVKMAAEFSDFMWVDMSESSKLKCIEGIPEEVGKTIAHYLHKPV